MLCTGKLFHGYELLLFISANFFSCVKLYPPSQRVNVSGEGLPKAVRRASSISASLVYVPETNTIISPYSRFTNFSTFINTMLIDTNILLTVSPLSTPQ